jgi:L-rhamnose-H+ transport protein
MSAGMLLGLLIVIAGGLMEGAFTFPLKLTRKRWAWENIWAAGSLAALLLVPWPLALATVPQLGEVYRHCSWKTLAVTVLFGAAWGTGGIFFGLGVAALACRWGSP